MTDTLVKAVVLVVLAGAMVYVIRQFIVMHRSYKESMRILDSLDQPVTAEQLTREELVRWLHDRQRDSVTRVCGAEVWHGHGSVPGPHDWMWRSAERKARMIEQIMGGFRSGDTVQSGRRDGVDRLEVIREAGPSDPGVNHQ
jgi:hypothetical protein